MSKTSIWQPIAVAVGLLALTACGGPIPSVSAPAEQASGTGFSTQWYGGGGGYSGYGGYGGFGGGYGGGCGFGGGYGTCGFAGGGPGYGFGNVPVSGDIFGGTTFYTGRGRLDRQPASLPYGVAEENDEAYRPLGSAIWQKK